MNIKSMLGFGPSTTSHAARQAKLAEELRGHDEALAEHERQATARRATAQEAHAAARAAAEAKAAREHRACELAIVKDFAEVDDMIRRFIDGDDQRRISVALGPKLAAIVARTRDELGETFASARLVCSFAAAAGQLGIVGNNRFFEGPPSLLTSSDAVVRVAVDGAGGAPMQMALLSLEVAVEHSLRVWGLYPSEERAAIFMSHVGHASLWNEMHAHDSRAALEERAERAREQESFQREAQREQAGVALAAAERARNEPFDR